MRPIAFLCLACLLPGCATTLKEYQPDGKTLKSELRVGITHEVRRGDLTVAPSESVVAASQATAIALGTAAIKVGGAAIAGQMIDRASEAATESSKPP